MAARDTSAARKTARGRLLSQYPAPRGWVPGWSPAAPMRRCSCGAPLVVRTGRFSRCERGCTRLLVAPRPQSAPPPPPPPAEFTRLLTLVRGLERDLVRDVRKGKPPRAHVAGLAVKAAESVVERFPACASEVWSALPWLARRRAELSFLAERTTIRARAS